MVAARTSSPPHPGLTWRAAPVTHTSMAAAPMVSALPGALVRKDAPAKTGSTDVVQTEEHQRLELTLKAVGVQPACLAAVLMATPPLRGITLMGAKTRTCPCLPPMSVGWRRTGGQSATLLSDGHLTWSTEAAPGSGMAAQAETETILTPKKNATRYALIPSEKMLASYQLYQARVRDTILDMDTTLKLEFVSNSIMEAVWETTTSSKVWTSARTPVLRMSSR